MGVEYALTSNLILGAEYLHIDLENRTHAGFNNLAGPCLPRNHSVNADADVVSGRLSFKFGRDEPVVRTLK